VKAFIRKLFWCAQSLFGDGVAARLSCGTFLALSITACTNQLVPVNNGGGTTEDTSCHASSYGLSTSPGSGVSFTLSGTARYTSVPVSGGLAYGSSSLVPIRRAVLQALQGSTVVATTNTNDNGEFSLAVNVNSGGVTLRVLARSTISSYVADTLGGTGFENCNGASWDVRILNNVTNNSASATSGCLRNVYAVSGSTEYTANTSGITLDAVTSHSTNYTSRNGSPFALLDTAIRGIEAACEGSASQSFPLLFVNWSSSNTTSSSGGTTAGGIGTSYFTTEGSSSIANLYILGREDVDTDEYDKHVVAHEFGHYLENKVFRSDSIGGAHSMGDSLDPRVAFGEGFGNAFSGMVYRDPSYVDTSGTNQGSAFSINVSTAPTASDRGHYSERSMQYLLWNLWENTDGSANSGSFNRIFNILANYQKNTPALTTGHSFSAHYNAVYGGSAESLNTYLTVNSATLIPYNSLCSGACAGTGDTADVWDTDNDFSEFRTGGFAPRAYRSSSGSTFADGEFWRLYRTVTSGTNTANAHDVINYGGYSVSSSLWNKFGLTRFYRYVSTINGNVTVRIANPTRASGAASCTAADLLDLYVYRSGTLLAYDIAETGSTASCPQVTFSASSGTTYVLTVRGYGSATTDQLTAFDVVVSP
jgi:hypothetical protein